MKCINLYLSFKWNKELSLFIALLIMSLFYNYQHVFQQGPYSIHMWRQTDCLAITQGYYQDNANLLEPSMSYQVGGTGRCVSEFPLFYYINAQVWKLVGKSEFLFRLFTFSIVMIGLLFLYWLIRAVLKSHFWAMGLTLFVFTSPVFVFYANSFMGNVPAVSMVFIAWYFFYKFHSDSSHDTYLIGCALIILLVGLIRISLLYTFSFIYLIYVIELFTSYRFGIDRKLFERKIKQVVILATPILIILSWVVYATHYNTINHSEGLFLVNLRPIWVMERADLLETTRMLFYYNNLPTLLFSFVGVLLFIGCSAFLLYHVNKLNKIVQLILYSLFIGCSLYVLFFYASFRVHDYYYLELIPLLFAVFGVFVYTIKMNWPVVYMSRNFKIGFLLFLLLSSVYCAAKHRI